MKYHLKVFAACVTVAMLVAGVHAAEKPSAPSHKASFDCIKAATRVEKVVCADANLSKLDEKLNLAYKNAQKDEKRSEDIRRTQHQWLKNRNACSDAICVKQAYEMRLASLIGDKKSISNFSGQWHIELCNKGISKECGGFTVYLIQVGNKLCGDHFFATSGAGRLNDGAPRSIIGSVSESDIADIVITSGRNGAAFRVRATKNDEFLNWEIIEEIKHSPDSDSALVLEKGKLRRIAEDDRYRAAFSACQSH